jgi:hypothetical protein
MKQRCLQRLLGGKMLKFQSWSRNKRALSPIFATVLLAAIIIVVGSVAYYYSSNLTNTATNNYVQTLTDSKQTMSERLGFENVVYTQSTRTLTVYLINYGGANAVKMNAVFIYDQNNAISAGSPYSGAQLSVLKSIDTQVAIPNNCLNIGQEGYFTITLSAPISGPRYTLHLITQSGGYFDYAFSP